ncbi:pre-mRNA-splicing factor 18, partial [Tanacetum coccineum]
MDILKQELAKKRKTLAEQTGGRKTFKRSEIEQKRIQNLKEEQKQELETKLKHQTPSIPNNTDTKLKKPEPTTNINTSNNNNVSNEQKIDSLNLTKLEVIRRLRFLKQPVTLFGESDDDRLDRLKYVLKSGLFELDDSDMTEGQTNDFLRDIVELKKRQKSGVTSDRKRKASEESREEGDGDGEGSGAGVDWGEDEAVVKKEFGALC